MSLLARYKKQGGFEQLILLLESRPPKKRDELIELIVNEDAAYGVLVQTKILTMEKLIEWDPNILSEVISKLSDLTVSTCFSRLGEEFFKKCSHGLREFRKKELSELIRNANPKQPEFDAAWIKFIEATRKLVTEGAIKLDDNDQPINNMTKKKTG